MSGLVTAKDLRAKRARLHTEGTGILEDAVGRDLTAEERQNYDRIYADIDAIKSDIDRVERHESEERELSASKGQETREVRPVEGAEEDRAADFTRAHNQAFDAYLRYGVEGMDVEQRKILRSTYQRDESRAAQTVTTTAGGYLIPQGFSGQLEASMLAYGGMETVGDVFTTETGNTLPWPTVNDTAVTGRLLAINTSVTNTAVTYGVVNFAAYKFSSDSVLVPVELAQDSAFDLNAHLADVLATRLARVHNTYQTTGTASAQPGGVITGASSGVTAASATAVTYNELLDLEHSVDPAYRNTAMGTGFLFNDSTFKNIRKLVDSDGRPLWAPGLIGSAPDTISGWSYTINQDMAAMTTGLKPIAFGAMKKFKIRKVKGFTLLRLVERYADDHQIGYLAFTRMDSKVLDAGTDPIKYITMA